MEAIFWLGAVIVLVIIEIATLGLTTIWFAGGALVACIAWRCAMRICWCRCCCF